MVKVIDLKPVIRIDKNYVSQQDLMVVKYELCCERAEGLFKQSN